MIKSNLFIMMLSLVLFSCNQENKAESYEHKTITENNHADEKKLNPAQMTTVEFEKDFYDLPKMKEGEKISQYYYFTNTGDKPFTITEVQVSCGCTAPEYPQSPVLPGQKDSIKLEFDSSGKHGDVNKNATVIGNTKEPKVLRFTAHITN